MTKVNYTELIDRARVMLEAGTKSESVTAQIMQSANTSWRTAREITKTATILIEEA